MAKTNGKRGPKREPNPKRMSEAERKARIVEPMIKDPAERAANIAKACGGLKFSRPIDFVRMMRGR